MRSIKIYVFVLLISIAGSSSLFSQQAGTKRELMQKFMEALETQGQEAIIGALESGDAETKVACFQALTKKGASDQNIINLVNVYITYGYYDRGLSPENRSQSWLVRNEAIKTAGTLKSESSVVYLSSILLQEKNQAVVISAINALGEIGDTRATAPLLTYLLVATKFTVVNEIILALGKIGSVEALPALINIVQDSKYSMPVKNNAIEAIKKLKQAPTNNTPTN